MCVCLQGLYFVCARVCVCGCVCICQCVHHTLTLAAGCLQYLPAAPIFSHTLTHTNTHTHTHTHTHTPSLSLPVSHDGEWSRCWGPIVAQCHFLVLLISSLCCRWLSLKGSTHMLMYTRTHWYTLAHTRTQPYYLLTSPSTALPLAPRWQQRLWLSAWFHLVCMRVCVTEQQGERGGE